MSVLGVEGEEREDLTGTESRQLRDRSVRLLGSLLRPLRGKVAWTIVVVVISTTAQVASAVTSDPSSGTWTSAGELSFAVVAGALSAELQAASRATSAPSMKARVARLKRRLFRSTGRLMTPSGDVVARPRRVPRKRISSARSLRRDRNLR